MPLTFVRTLSVFCLFVLALPGCNQEADAPTAPTCLLTSATDQLVESNGQLTNPLQRSFIYTGQTLTALVDLSPGRTSRFTCQRTNDRLVEASNGQEVIALAYAGNTTLPTSATFSRAGVRQSAYLLEYTPAGQLRRLIERREVLPANSLTIERTYTFTYDTAGNLTTEQAQFILAGGSVVRQETEYSFTDKPSPYARFSERPLLTLIALSLGTETGPARFWQQHAPASYKTYSLSPTGSRDILRESVTCTPTVNATTQLTALDQTALLYQGSNPNPVTRTNRQTFAYACE